MSLLQKNTENSDSDSPKQSLVRNGLLVLLLIGVLYLFYNQ